MAVGSAAPQFELLRSQAAAAVAAARGGCFQSARWVHAVAAARGRAHELVAVRARWRDGRQALLPGAVHSRYGLRVFESMPMGGYGGWIADDALSLEDECALNRAWLDRAAWPLVLMTSAPGRAAVLPAAAGIAPRGPDGLRPKRFTTHVLDLTGDDAALLQRAQPRLRSYLRRFDALGFEFELARDAAACERMLHWYRAGSRAWQQPASTCLPAAFFEALGGDGADVWTVRQHGREVGAALFLVGAHEVQYQASGTERIEGPLSAMEALLWAAARRYRDRGLRTLNLGASEGLASVARFKAKFGARELPYLRVSYLLPRLFGTRSGVAEESLA